MGAKCDAFFWLQPSGGGLISGLLQNSAEQPLSTLMSPLTSFVRGLRAQLPWGQLGDAQSSWALHMDALDL